MNSKIFFRAVAISCVFLAITQPVLAENQQLFRVILAAFLAANILNKTVLNPLIRSIYALIDAPLKAQGVSAGGKSEGRGLSIKVTR
ncbi:hypothetical protein [Moritella sp. JT01]|uniref:hypothetical protein n=1 Tax=Moritella sp. JT01 TaxID=756698 RepID=UPI0008345AFB|nr:hypothetical protein [Moritella sp. JT01]